MENQSDTLKDFTGKIRLDLFSSNPDSVLNVTASFILLCNHNGNLYALTGGYGHTKLKKYIVENFGLGIALRMINEQGISAINQRAMKGNTRQIYRAVTGYDPIFDRENYTRILNLIAGMAEFEGRTFRIIGKDSLSLRTTKDINKIGEVFDEIEVISSKQEKIHFPKSYNKINNKTLIEQLNSKMFSAIQEYWKGNENRERLYLEFKDPFIQFRCSKFKVTFNRKSFEFIDFDLDIVREVLRNGGTEEIEKFEDLKHIKFAGFSEDGFEEFSDENFYNLLVCEISEENKSYIKFEKEWLQINDEIKSYIDSEIKKIEIIRNLLPRWVKNRYSTEKDYNDYVATQKGWKCLDRDFLYVQGRSKIEVCDIFNKSANQFFHIKETWGSKSAYLFTQGVTSAEFYRNSEEFRNECRKKWPDEFVNNPAQCEVIFGIASNQAIDDKFPLNMTFFAKLNLYRAAVDLKQLDFNVKLVPIEILER